MHQLQRSNPIEVFIDATALLMNSKKVYNLTVACDAIDLLGSNELRRLARALDDGMRRKEVARHGTKMRWSRWLYEGVFPQTLYREHDYSLRALIMDERFGQAPILSFKKLDNFHSFFGRVGRPRPVFEGQPHYKGFLDFALGRWEDARQSHGKRSMPHFYFDVESPEWILKELIHNPNQPRTGRTSQSCVSNVSLRWDPKEKRAIITLILKHNQWSHMWGDIFGGVLFGCAWANELKLARDPLIVVTMMSATLDEPKAARLVMAKGWA